MVAYFKFKNSFGGFSNFGKILASFIARPQNDWNWFSMKKKMLPELVWTDFYFKDWKKYKNDGHQNLWVCEIWMNSF